MCSGVAGSGMFDHIPRGSHRAGSFLCCIRKRKDVGGCVNVLSPPQSQPTLTEEKSKKMKRRPQMKRRSQAEVMKEREDECFSCGDGGQLVSCKKPGCPKVYHADCLNLTKRPAGQCSPAGLCWGSRTGHGLPGTALFTASANRREFSLLNRPRGPQGMALLCAMLWLQARWLLSHPWGLAESRPSKSQFLLAFQSCRRLSEKNEEEKHWWKMAVKEEECAACLN